MSALKGLRVVELANERLAFAGKLLGDMGADVILVEPPGGDPSRHYPPWLDDEPGEDRSLYWWHYNTSKRSVVLDLDEPSDQQRFRNLIKSADILIESENTQRLATLSLDYADMCKLNPGLIHAAMTSYGRNHPDSNLPVTDLTILAGGGPVWSCGYDDHRLPPVRGWGNQGYHTGCHFTFMGVLTALMNRLLSGEGQFVDVSMHAAANITTESATYAWHVARATVLRQTGRHAGARPSGETQKLCADGHYANTGVPPRKPADFASLAKWLSDSGLDHELPEAVFLQMGAVWEGPFDLSLIGTDDTITAIFGAGREALKLLAGHLSAQDFFIGCQEAGLATGPVNTPEETFEDPHFIARGFQVEVTHEDLGRTFRYPGAPYKLPASPWAIGRRAPKLGEHTQAVFAELPI
ncbi:MAG: CoA transferase [Proteobacteria bacterium]|nr:CoA transferase [Pseudomonadota bacterium]